MKYLALRPAIGTALTFTFALTFTLPLAVQAQSPAWPTKPITLVVGSAPGGKPCWSTTSRRAAA